MYLYNIQPLSLIQNSTIVNFKAMSIVDHSPYKNVMYENSIVIFTFYDVYLHKMRPLKCNNYY